MHYLKTKSHGICTCMCLYYDIIIIICSKNVEPDIDNSLNIEQRPSVPKTEARHGVKSSVYSTDIILTLRVNCARTSLWDYIVIVLQESESALL